VSTGKCRHLWAVRPLLSAWPATGERTLFFGHITQYHRGISLGLLEMGSVVVLEPNQLSNWLLLKKVKKGILHRACNLVWRSWARGLLLVAIATRQRPYSASLTALEFKVFTSSQTSAERVSRRADPGREKEALFPHILFSWFIFISHYFSCYISQNTQNLIFNPTLCCS